VAPIFSVLASKLNYCVSIAILDVEDFADPADVEVTGDLPAGQRYGG
jgi:hypothetical protein